MKFKSVATVLIIVSLLCAFSYASSNDIHNEAQRGHTSSIGYFA
ncbi:RapA phosphatase inhibitor PhrA1 [Bacillus pumilus]|nr:RapA phosphatase inhibitor PhrA1 [Bacillus pumilus]